MNEDIDAWLNADVAADVAKAGGAKPVPAPAPPAAAPIATAPAAGTSLQKTFGIGRGGVIRNPNTKKVTMTSNPVATPKTTKLGLTKAVNPPTPEEELAAEHPALVIPTIMTGMDMDTAQPKNGATESSVDVPNVVKPVQTGQPMPVTYDSTLRELLMLAFNSGGILHFGTGEFVLSIQLTIPASKSQE